MRISLFLALAACLLGLAVCQFAPGDIDWGDYLHPPRLPKTYRGGEETYIITANEKWSAWYMMQDRTAMVFSVKACSSVSILLSDMPAADDYTLEIVLGMENNQRSAIRYFYEMGSLFEQQTSEILHCNEYRSFWIKWGADIIDVGRGPIIGEQKFLNYLDRNFDYFISIGFGSRDGNSASWKLQENAGDFIEIVTPNQHRYTNMWKAVENKRFWSFSVVACAHVHVLLSETLGNQETNIYELVFGGWDNTKSGIRKFVRGDLIEEHNSVVLSCTDSRDFWVGWVNGSIEMGRGLRYGHNRLVRYRDPNPTPIRWLSITTGFGEEGAWRIDDNLAATNVRLTPKADTSSDINKYNNTWFESNQQRWTTFQVRTCSRASLVFAEYAREMDPEESYQVVLGFEGNEKSGVGFLHELGWLDEAVTPQILDCDNMRDFWVSWYNHTLRVGKGRIFGQQEILHTMIASDFNIGAYSISTPDVEGEWRFRDYFGERVDVHTKKEYDINQYWLQVPDHTLFPFRVRACSDVHVILSPTVGHDYVEMYYDIVIAGWVNSATQIRQVRGDGTRVDESIRVETPNLLDCDSFVNLYVSWEGNTVTVGSGEFTGIYEILKHSFSNWDPPKAISLSSYTDYDAWFSIEQDQGDTITFYTNRTKSQQYDTVYMVTNPWLHWKTFVVRSCGGVNIDLLTSTDDYTKLLHYSVQLGVENGAKSKIIDGDGNQLKSEDTPNILHCDHSRDFWVSWGDKKIEAGAGPLAGRNVLISTAVNTEEDFFPTVIGFDTVEDHYGRWIVKENAAYQAEFYTPVDYGFFYMWTTLEHKEYLAFVSYACSDVHVALTDKLSFDRNQHIYEIVIGGWENTRSVIRHNGVHRADVMTEGILQCDDETVPVEFFWITWHGGSLVVGKGLFVGEGRFMDYSPINPPTNVRAAGYSTGYGHAGLWVIPLINAVVTPPVTEAPPITEGGGGGLSGGAIFGIVFGCIVLVLLGTLVGLFVLNRRGHLQPPGWLSGQQDQNPMVPMEPFDASGSVAAPAGGAGGAGGVGGFLGGLNFSRSFGNPNLEATGGFDNPNAADAEEQEEEEQPQKPNFEEVDEVDA